MKFLCTSLLTSVLACSYTVSAQTTNESAQTSQKAEIFSDSPKSSFIKNQDYLSNSSVRFPETFHPDSLRGFNEEAVRVELNANNVYGTEYANLIINVKRDFINRKYQIGPYSPFALKTAQAQTRPISTPSSIPGPKNLGGASVINVAPCVNEGFESTAPGQYNTANAILGWTVASGQNTTAVYSPNTNYGVGCNANARPSWNAGSPELWIVQTPIVGVPNIGTLPNSPLGGTRVIKLNDATANSNYIATRIKSTFPVTSANTLFQFAYAGSWDGVHECCGQPAFRIDMYQEPCQGGGTATLLPCSNVSLTPSGNQCSSGVSGYSVTNGVSWTNWVVKFIDLTPYIGTCVTIQVTNADCAYGGHHGSAYFDAMCGGQLIGSNLSGFGGFIPGPVSFCAGANQAVITAPLGYSTYSWVAPSNAAPIAAPQATLPTLTIFNPIANAVYTVYMLGQSGCQFVSTNTLAFTTINIAGIGSTSTCIGGSSGTATVQGFGSGTGYNYTWINAQNNATISSGSTPGNIMSVNGLAPGVYSVVLTGFGAIGCGSAVATTTITTGLPPIISLVKPYCAQQGGTTQAYLSMPGGSNFQWYAGLSIISPTAGGTASSYTVNNPLNQGIYWLSYTSQFGCRDSVKFTMISSASGNMVVTGVPLICSGSTSGSATINMFPAPNAPGGSNYFYVNNLGTTTPVYNASVNPTSLSIYTVSGLAAGTYTVRAFDGSCKYNTSFSVTAHTYQWNLTPTTAIACPGDIIFANVSFASGPPSPTQYTYSWTPNLHLAGNTNSSTTISPSIPVGTQTTIVYTVVVTPSLVNCPTSQTIAITAVNPVAITINPIPNLCNNSNPYQINVSPAPGALGPGAFIGNLTGTNNPINSVTGLLSPTFAANGINSFVYSYTVAGSPCSVSKSATFEVSQFRTAALTSVVPPLCVNNGPFNLMNIVQSAAGGIWKANWTNTSTTPTNAVSGNQFIPSALNSQIPQTSNYAITYNTTSSPNPTVCPDASTLSVAVTRTVTPNITPVPAFCTNAAQINMTVSPTGGGWISNSAVSNQGVLTPLLIQPNQVPNSTVVYSVANGPCINTATTTLNTSTFYPAALTGTIYPLCFSSGPVNLMSLVQNTTNAVWSGTMGIAPNTSSFIPAGLQTGVYTLTLNTQSAPITTLCPDMSTIAVSVLNPPQPNISNVGSFCSNEPALQLTVTPATGWWTSSAYVSPSGIFTPSLASVGNSAIQYKIGITTCNREQTKFVNIEAFVPAKITSALPDQCSTGSPVSLVPITLTSFGTWSGPGISGNTFNPALTGSGTFTITHSTASSPSGFCPDVDAIAVNVYSLATPEITPAGPFCNSSHPVQLKVSPVGGLFGGSSMGVVSLAGKFDPGSASIGDNFVTYSITSGPCLAYAQVTISVEKFVSADFQKSVAAICLVPGKTNPINMNSYVQYPGGFWSGPGIAGNMFDPFQANKGKNNVVVYRTHSMPTATLCPDTSAVRIEVRDVPKVTALSNLDKACSPAEIYFNTPNVMDGVGVGTWNFDDGTEPEAGLNITHIYTRPGTYNVTFTYKDDIGCEALPAKVNPVYIHEIPKADFSIPDEVFISNPDVQLTNLTTVLGDNTYQWKISNLYTLNQVNPVVSLPKIGRYQITLIATTPIGCTDQITKTVEVKNDFNIYIPSSFSPNFDGLNDIFIPVFSEYGLDHKSFEMEIFDRWGHSLFRTKEITKGWDGSVQNKGEPLKEEVYIYKIKYKDLDGNAYSKMGHLTLIK